MPYILENTSNFFVIVRKVFRKKLGLWNSVIFQKEQGQLFQNQTNSRECLYCQEIPN